MDRRKFLQGVAAASLTPALTRAEDAAPKTGAIERRALGRTGEKLSVIGFGGLVLNGVEPRACASYVAEAFERGINYYDVAPAYGNAQERMGPALKPFRDRCFLACKTKARDAAGAQKELENSLKLLETDRFDLYQLHVLSTVEEVEQAFGPGGAMEAMLKAREAGKVRFLGFSAHSEEAALAAMKRFDFDTVLFPLNFAMWHKNNFGPAVLERAREKQMGILAIKAMIHQAWPSREAKQRHKWKKMWYEPLDDAARATLALRFTLGMPVTSAVPPGEWELFKMGLEIAQKGLASLNEQEGAKLKELAQASNPLFPRHG